jgi:hypothetical protein
MATTAPQNKNKNDDALAQATDFLTHRICPVCEEPFRIPSDLKGRPPIYCTPACRQIGQKDPRHQIRRHCPTCDTAHTVDMTGKSGSAGTYCSELCKERFASLNRYRHTRTCPQCRGYLPPHQQFCTRICTMNYYVANPPEACRNCGEPTPFDPDVLRMPPKFCNRACREQYLGIDNFRAAEAALRDRDMDSAQRSRKFRRKGKKGDKSAKPHQYLMAVAHMEKLRWGLYPEKLLIQILQLGWRDEAEFFLTEDRWSPAVYDRLTGVGIESRQFVSAQNLTVRNYGETDGTVLPPDEGAPATAEYRRRAKEIIASYRRESEEPEYVETYRLATGRSPERN